jgi:hypothetical protein
LFSSPMLNFASKLVDPAMSRSATLTQIRIIVASLAMGVAGFSAQPANAQTANAQIDRRATLGRPIILTIKPRSYLDAGVVVPVGSLSGPESPLMQTKSYLLHRPYSGSRERFGEGVLPDPIQNTPMIGARNPFGPIDFYSPESAR